MARSDIQQRMEALRGTNAGLMLAEFYRERLAELESKFVSCTKETFETHKGRCLEMQDLIAFIEGRNNR